MSGLSRSDIQLLAQEIEKLRLVVSAAEKRTRRPRRRQPEVIEARGKALETGGFVSLDSIPKPPIGSGG